MGACLELVDVWMDHLAKSVTGTTAETLLASITIPPNAMGPMGFLEIVTLWSNNSNANNKQARIRLGGIGGAQPLSLGISANISMQQITWLRNRGVHNSQIGYNANTGSGIGSSSGAVFTAAVDTSLPQDLVFTGQLNVAGDTLTLESYIVKLFKLFD